METTIDVPAHIVKSMKKHRLLDWNAAVAHALILQVSERELVEEILKGSSLTEADAKKISEKVREGLSKHYGA